MPNDRLKFEKNKLGCPKVLKTEQLSSLANQANTATFLYGGFGLFVITVVVITSAQLHSGKPDLRLRAGSNPACGASPTMVPVGNKVKRLLLVWLINHQFINKI